MESQALEQDMPIHHPIKREPCSLRNAMTIWMALLAVLFLSCNHSFAAQRQSNTALDQIVAKERVSALRSAIRSGNLQTSLPEDRPAPPERALDLPQVGIPDAKISSIAQVMLWISVLVILLVLVMNMKDNLWSFSRSRRIEAEKLEQENVETADRMTKTGYEADGQANTGDYAEAMHLLLLQSLTELRRRLDVSFAISLTSREILNMVRLNEEGKAAFADIVGRVEISHFGSHTPSEQDYLACRRSFDALAHALTGGQA